MYIREAQKEDQARWDAFVQQHPLGLAYHQFAWKESVKDAYHLDGYYLLAEENQSVVGVLPLVLCRSLFFKTKFVSLPFCDVGGVLANNDLVAANLIEHAINLSQQHNVAEIEIRAQCTMKEGPLEAGAAQKVRMVLALPENSEQLLAHLKAKVRSQVKKPLRDGLFAKIGGLELIDDFYSVFVRNMRDLGSPVHSRAWIHAVLYHFGSQARVVVVYTPQGYPAAAGVMLLHPAAITNPWSSSLRSFRHLNPNMLLYWTMLSYAANNGFPCFDFGRSTRGSGTYKFKQQWNAQEIDLHWKYIIKNKYIPSGSHPSYLRMTIENIWKRLPLGLTTVIGPLFRRHIPL